MFGHWDKHTAERIADTVSARVQARCVVFPSKDEPGKFTIGVPAGNFSTAELRALLTADDFKRLQDSRFAT